MTALGIISLVAMFLAIGGIAYVFISLVSPTVTRSDEVLEKIIAGKTEPNVKKQERR